MKILSKNDIALARDTEPVALAVPEWGPEAGVMLKRLTGREREALAKAIEKDEIDAVIERKAFVAFVCDEAGVPIFGPDDLGIVAERCGHVVARIAREGLKLNGFAKGAVEEARKN